jgi:NhaP-type Na+/H+ and K+/H+ antiporter
MLVNDKVVSATFSISDTVGSTLQMSQGSNLPYNLYLIICLIIIISTLLCRFYR